MIKKISNEKWQQFLSFDRFYEPDSPDDKEHLYVKGSVFHGFSYIHADSILEQIKDWLTSRSEESVYYFITQSVENEEAPCYEISIDDIQADVLSELCDSFESVLVGKDFKWALSFDHESYLHVSGSEELSNELLSLLLPFRANKENENPALRLSTRLMNDV
ncbi:MAG: hypothetical protein KY468_08195 [Armatimonadetes bacterium]|nr:hypothetical protein [Armatimonadota bacterium]